MCITFNIKMTDEKYVKKKVLTAKFVEKKQAIKKLGK